MLVTVNCCVGGGSPFLCGLSGRRADTRNSLLPMVQWWEHEMDSDMAVSTSVPVSKRMLNGLCEGGLESFLDTYGYNWRNGIKEEPHCYNWIYSVLSIVVMGD